MQAYLRRLIVFSLFFAVSHSFAQNASSIQGVVQDATGAAIPGATVRIEAQTNSSTLETKTGAQGEFSFKTITDSHLSLVVPAYSGFAAYHLALTDNIKTSGLKIVLTPETISQEVNVGADHSLSTDPANNFDAVTITADDLAKVPVFDQDYIAALTPFLDASSGASGGVSIVVDGVEMKSVGVSASAIQEVRINNDPYSAEFVRPGRGRIDVTTKPGSPEFHGETNFIFRNAIFNAKNYFAVVRPPESRRIYEGHLTGPVGHGGHTTFIASGSRREQDTATAVDAIGPYGPIQENVPTPRRNAQASMRVTHDFSPNNRLSLGYNFQSGNYVNAGVGGIVLPEAGYTSQSREDDAIFNQRIIVTPNLINQLQVTLEKDEDVVQSVTNAQSVVVSGAFIGGGAQADVSKTENTIHVNETASWSHRNHYVRFGVQLPQFSKRAVDDHTNRLGTFQFASIANYSSNSPYVFTEQQGVGRGLYWANEVGAFVQDQIKLSSSLELTLGLRYDWQTYLSDDNNLAPRVSGAYTPDKGKTVFRSGAGVFYDRTGGDFPATVKLHNGLVLHTVQLQNPGYPIPPGTNFAATPTNLVRFADSIRTPYSVQYSVSVEREIAKGINVTAGYRGAVQIKSFRSRDVNAPLLPPHPSLTAVYARPDPNFGQIQQIESAGRGIINALDIGFRGKAGRVFTGQAQYTLSRWLNNTGGISAFPQDQYHPNDEWGRANQDQLHKFNLIGNINPGHWLSLGVGATLYSGTPYTETTGNDYFHTGLGNSRPVGVARNTLQASGVASLDLLYSHDFKLTHASGDKAKVMSAGVSAFNVLNRTNFTNYIGAESSSLFLQPTVAQPGRQIQFSLSYRF